MMLNRFTRWIRQQGQWQSDHRAAWAGADELGADGLSRFQHLCLTCIEAALSRIGRSLIERRVELGPFGEPMVVARVSTSGVRVWLYTDQADFAAESSSAVFERWDARTPEELCQKFTASVLTTLSRGGNAPA